MYNKKPESMLLKERLIFTSASYYTAYECKHSADSVRGAVPQQQGQAFSLQLRSPRLGTRRLARSWQEAQYRRANESKLTPSEIKICYITEVCVILKTMSYIGHLNTTLEFQQLWLQKSDMHSFTGRTRSKLHGKILFWRRKGCFITEVSKTQQ